MRTFELGDRRWAIAVEANLVKLAWGDRGKPEQRHDRTLASPEAAIAYRDLQIAKQLELGYVEVFPAPEPVRARVPGAPTRSVEPEAPVTREIRFEIAAETRTEFRRYPKPARFMELRQRDRVLMEWNGELDHVDDPDKSPRRETTFLSIAEATEAFDDLVQSAREDRWRRVRSPEAVARHDNPALEAECWAAADDDPMPWSVYADWLLEQGDPLGELATLTSTSTAKRRIAAQLEDLGGYPEMVDVRRRHGFPRSVTIRSVDLDGADPTALAETAKALRSCSYGRFVDVFHVGLAGYSDRNDWAPTLRALAQAPHPERIRELHFDHYESTECEISWATMGDLSGLFAPFTGLEVLHLKSGAGGTLGELHLPSLRRFVRESGGLSAEEIASIMNATWPALEHLEIWTGDPNYGAASTVATLRAVFDRARFPALRHLGIVNSTWVEDVIDALAASKLLPQLHSLDLSKGIFARRGVELLRQHATLFRHLASIDLSENLLLPREAAQIRDVLDNVILVDQREREMEDYEETEADGEIVRYVAVGE